MRISPSLLLLVIVNSLPSLALACPGDTLCTNAQLSLSSVLLSNKQAPIGIQKETLFNAIESLNSTALPFFITAEDTSLLGPSVRMSLKLKNFDSAPTCGARERNLSTWTSSFFHTAPITFKTLKYCNITADNLSEMSTEYLGIETTCIKKGAQVILETDLIVHDVVTRGCMQ